MISQHRKALGRKERTGTIGEFRMALYGYRENNNQNLVHSWSHPWGYHQGEVSSTAWVDHRGTCTLAQWLHQSWPDGCVLTPGLCCGEAARARQRWLDRRTVSCWPVWLNLPRYRWLWLTFCLSQPFEVLKLYQPILHIFPSPSKLFCLWSV